MTINVDQPLENYAFHRASDIIKYSESNKN